MTETVELKCERLRWEVRKYQACVTGCVSAIDIACVSYSSNHKTVSFVHEHNLLWPSCKLDCGVIISKWVISDFYIVVIGSGMRIIFMFFVLFPNSPKTVPPFL